MDDKELIRQILRYLTLLKSGKSIKTLSQLEQLKFIMERLESKIYEKNN